MKTWHSEDLVEQLLAPVRTVLRDAGVYEDAGQSIAAGDRVADLHESDAAASLDPYEPVVALSTPPAAAAAAGEQLLWRAADTPLPIGPADAPARKDEAAIDGLHGRQLDAEALSASAVTALPLRSQPPAAAGEAAVFENVTWQAEPIPVRRMRRGVEPGPERAVAPVSAASAMDAVARAAPVGALPSAAYGGSAATDRSDQAASLPAKESFASSTMPARPAAARRVPATVPRHAAPTMTAAQETDRVPPPIKGGDVMIADERRMAAPVILHDRRGHAPSPIVLAAAPAAAAVDFASPVTPPDPAAPRTEATGFGVPLPAVATRSASSPAPSTLPAAADTSVRPAAGPLRHAASVTAPTASFAPVDTPAASPAAGQAPGAGGPALAVRYAGAASSGDVIAADAALARLRARDDLEARIADILVEAARRQGVEC